MNMEDKTHKQILETIQAIQSNIQQHGFYRFDPSDLREIKVLAKNRLFRLPILTIEQVFPYFIRRVFRIEKSIHPATYTHLANAYFWAEKNNIVLKNTPTATEIMYQCIDKYLTIEDGDYWWKYHSNDTFFPINELSSKRSTMPMHGLARCNIILCELGTYYNNKEFIDIAFYSARKTLNYHQVAKYSNGAMSISYYYNTNDCTLNVNTEFAHWISMLPLEMITDDMKNVTNGIIKLLLTEQNDDGSWYYFSKLHMKYYGSSPSCDCHHSGTVLYNLINVMKKNVIDNSLKGDLIKAVDKGMRFYIDSFFSKASGKAITLIGSARPAGPVQYSEAICAFCEYLSSDIKFDESIRSEVKILLPKAVNQVIKLINFKNGSCPSEKVIKWVNINSIRWGNGPVLQALMMYLSTYNKIYNLFD